MIGKLIVRFHLEDFKIVMMVSYTIPTIEELSSLGGDLMSVG